MLLLVGLNVGFWVADTVGLAVPVLPTCKRLVIFDAADVDTGLHNLIDLPSRKRFGDN